MEEALSYFALPISVKKSMENENTLELVVKKLMQY